MTLPPAIKSVRAALRRATDSATRERLTNTLRRLDALYGLREATPQDEGDMRRRKFVETRHPFEVRKPWTSNPP